MTKQADGGCRHDALEQEAESQLEGKPEGRTCRFCFDERRLSITRSLPAGLRDHLDQSMTKSRKCCLRPSGLQPEVATMPDPLLDDGLGDCPSDLAG